MIHPEGRLFLKPQLSGFCVWVLHHSVSLLLLSVAGSSQIIVGLVGDDITLPCQLEPAADVSAQTVEWARRDLDPRFVYLRRDGVELLIEQHPSYVGRAKLQLNSLKCGDVSLKLSKVKLSDTGTYRCLVPRFNKDSAVELVAGSVSSPIIQISKASSAVVLQCESRGWYPEPEVLWLDSEGNLLSAGTTETVRGPDDLYTVSSTVTVEKTDSNSFTCRVQQRDINQTRETLVHLPDDFFMDSSSSSARIIIGLVVCFTCVLIVGLLVWTIKRNKKHQEKTDLEQNQMFSNNTELQMLIGGERDRKHPMTASEEIKYFDTTKAKLEEGKKKNDEEMEHVEEIITKLTEQKNNLKNQREKLTSMLQGVKIQMKEKEKKLKDGAKTNKEKKKKKREEAKTDLEMTSKEYDELLKDTEKLLETTEDMINKMTEKKGKLKTDRDQFIKHLEVTEKQINELQRKLQLEQLEREKEQHEATTKNPV